jgi:mannosyl-oligosaccharide alpha-1,2-mannosidase
MFWRLGRIRRYLAILLVCASTLLWHKYGFWVLGPRVFSSSKTYTVNGFKYATSSYDWSRAPVYHPVEVMRVPPVDAPKDFPKVQARSSSKEKDEVAHERKLAIKAKTVKSWEAYAAHAWGQDELKPLSHGGRRTLCGWSAQIVDGLSTLWVMGLRDEFYKGVREVALIDWARTSCWTVNVFEVNIRYLGGILSAYDLSGEAILLAKAIELGDTLYAAFDTPNRMPVKFLNYGAAYRGRQVAMERMSGASGGTLCLEFTRLSQLTGDPKYYDATERIKKFFYKWQDRTAIPGIWPNRINWRDEVMDAKFFGIGAGMDSMYEYLPKMHIALGGLDAEYEEMTIKALDTIKRRMLFRPMTLNNEDILFAGGAVVDKKKILLVPDVQHLSCHTGGMYALAGKIFSRKDYVDLGARLTRGCVWAYNMFPTKIMPEKTRIVACRRQNGPCKYKKGGLKDLQDPDLPDGFMKMMDARYMLRPEAIESVFYMWRITGDQYWRDVAWDMWEAIVKETETKDAFASIEDVMVPSSKKIDSMEVSYIYLNYCKKDLMLTNLDILDRRNPKVFLPHL